MRSTTTLPALLLFAPAVLPDEELSIWPSSLLPYEEVEAPGYAVEDVNGDGIADLVVSREGGGQVLFGDGGGHFRAGGGALPPGATDGGGDLVAGDLDGDGDADLVAGDTTGNPFLPPAPSVVLHNDGGGVFTDGGQPPLTSPGDPSRMRLADLDGDSDLDLVHIALGPATVHFGDGVGGFLAGTFWQSGTTDLALSLEIADLDLDGDLDWALGRSGEDRIFLNDGSAAFTLDAALPDSGAGTTGIAAGDVDGDGDVDLFAARSGGPYPVDEVYQQTPAGWVAAGGLPDLFGYDADSGPSELEDMDGDGDLDLVVSFLSGRLTCYHNDGTGVFTQPGHDIPSPLTRTVEVAVLDLDGDSDPDVLDLVRIGLSKVYLNDGAGRLHQVDPDTTKFLPGLILALGDYGGSATGDLDGDGDLDAVAASYAASARAWMNDGRGVMVSGASVGLGSAWQDVAIGDVDGDGDGDVVFASDGENELARNDGGGGAFTAVASAFAGSFGLAAGVELADVDGDGDLDAYFSHPPLPGAPADQLWAGHGSAFTLDAAALPSPPSSSDALFVDIDLDGDVDLVSIGSSTELLRNEGGVLVDVTAVGLPPLASATTSVDAGDVDGDGDPDLVLSMFGGTGALLRNGGAGVFTAEVGKVPSAAMGPLGVHRLVLADMDLDDDLDLIATTGLASGPRESRIWSNDGTGTFSDASPHPQPGHVYPDGDSFAVDAVDVDDDGDPDLLTGQPKSKQLTRVHFNLSRHLFERGPARVGKTLRMELRGTTPGSAFTLAYSAGKVAVPLAPFGTLKLDTANLFGLLGSGSLDTDGRGLVSIPVPADPSLLGATVYQQAVVDVPPRFTNLVETTLTGL